MLPDRSDDNKTKMVNSYKETVAGNQLVYNRGIGVSLALHLVGKKGPNHRSGYHSQEVQNGWGDLDPSGAKRILKKVWFFKCNHQFILPCIIQVYGEKVSINRLFCYLLLKSIIVLLNGWKMSHLNCKRCSLCSQCCMRVRLYLWFSNFTYHFEQRFVHNYITIQQTIFLKCLVVIANWLFFRVELSSIINILFHSNSKICYCVSSIQLWTPRQFLGSLIFCNFLKDILGMYL